MKTLKQKIDIFLWAAIWLLPFFAYFVLFYREGGTIPVTTWIDTHFSFPFVKDIINNVWQTAFGSDLSLAGYLSYLVGVEIAHCLFDVLVFIPRFAHRLVEKAEVFGGSEK